MVEQKVADFSTPYQFNGKELDAVTGLYPDSYRDGARYYDPGLSIWMGVDPLADKFPNESPYNYVSNNPLRYTDPTGMEKEDWYEDQDGNMQYDAAITSQADLKAAGINGTYLGKQGSGIDPTTGESISYNCDGTTSCSSFGLAGVTITPEQTSSTPGTTNTLRTISGTSAGLSNSSSTVRLTNGGYNGYQFSPKLYPSGWQGGSVARINTYRLSTTALNIGRGSLYASIALGAYNINSANIQDGRTFGYHSQVATAQTAGGIVGGYIGVKAGAATGAAFVVWFGGVGAVPGAIIGGIIGGLGGGLGGSYLGGAAVRSTYRKP